MRGEGQVGAVDAVSAQEAQRRRTGIAQRSAGQCCGAVRRRIARRRRRPATTEQRRASAEFTGILDNNNLE